jgi:hypothetical protein
MPGGKKRTKPVDSETIEVIKDGIKDLKMARMSFEVAEANNVVIAVNRAIKSAEGALRHARRMNFKAADPAQVSPS